MTERHVLHEHAAHVERSWEDWCNSDLQVARGRKMRLAMGDME